MKKFLAVLFAITLVISMTTVFATADETTVLAAKDIEFVANEEDVSVAPQGGSSLSALIDGDATEATAFATAGIVLFQNLHCTEQDVFTEFSLVVELEEVSNVSTVVLDFYHEYNSMIGFPKDNEVKIERSTDGTAFLPVETLTFEAEATASTSGVENVVLNLTNDIEAKYIKLTFNYGSSPFDTDGKVMWEWMGLTEVAFLDGEAPADTSEEVSETSETPSTGDNGYIAFIAIAVISLAGAVVVKKVRRGA